MIRISNWTSTRKFYTKWEHMKFNKVPHIDFCCYYAQQVSFARIISFMLFTVDEFLIHNSWWFLKNNSQNLLGLCLNLLNTYNFPAKGTLTDRLTDWLKDKYTRCAWAGRTFFPVVLLCQFLVLAGNRFWFYILTGLEYNTVVALCQFLVLAGNIFWCYIRT